jgi:hypothetical protein
MADKKEFSFLEKAPSKPMNSGPFKDEVSRLKEEVEDLKLQLELHGIVVDKYQKFIEDGETKSISELRSLVRPMDSVITEFKIAISDQFHPYVYDSHFLLAVQKSLDMVFSFKRVKMPVSFWLSFSDMVRLKAADDIDRAIILCSLFRSLGSETASVLIGKDKTAWVSFGFGKKMFIVDIANRVMSAYPVGEEGFKQFMYKMQYAFNDKEYEDFSK